MIPKGSASPPPKICVTSAFCHRIFFFFLPVVVLAAFLGIKKCLQKKLAGPYERIMCRVQNLLFFLMFFCVEGFLTTVFSENWALSRGWPFGCRYESGSIQVQPLLEKQTVKKLKKNILG